MSDLSFNKNRFIKSNPATLSKPLPTNINGFGRRTIEEIKTDMHSINKPKTEVNKQKMEDLQKNKRNNLNHLKPFKDWNNK